MKDNFPKKGDIYWVQLDPTEGKEIKKTRPCLVVSSDIANHSELIIVAPITSNVTRIFRRIEVKITLNGKPGKVLPRQMRAIDRVKRIGKKIGSVSHEEMNEIDNAMRLILDL